MPFTDQKVGPSNAIPRGGLFDRYRPIQSEGLSNAILTERLIRPRDSARVELKG
jgi:hypothetical protein